MPQSSLAMAIHVFGLTGGIATGKSAVAARWRERGLPVVDADQLAREVVEPGSGGLKAVVDLFGSGILRKDGTLDRGKLGERVFSNPEARASLERILHPLIGVALTAWTQHVEARGEPLACYEAPLLVETGRADAFRPLVLVAAKEETQLERALRRDGITERAIRARLAAQLPLEQKASKADFVLVNDGTREQLQEDADKTLAKVCERLGMDTARYFVGQALPN